MKNAYIDDDEELLILIEDVSAFNEDKGACVFCLCGLAVPYQQVLQSAAGFYIGTAYYDDEIGVWLPNSRDSRGYYLSMDEALESLRLGKYMYQ